MKRTQGDYTAYVERSVGLADYRSASGGKCEPRIRLILVRDGALLGMRELSGSGGWTVDDIVRVAELFGSGGDPQLDPLHTWALCEANRLVRAGR